MTASRGAWLRLLAGVAFALLAADAGAPAPARAECGDYVMRLGERHPSPPPAVPPDGPTQACHGPNCSALPVAPPLSRAVPVTLTTDWATAARAAAPEPDPRAAAVADRGAGKPIDTPSSIFHPPKSRG